MCDYKHYIHLTAGHHTSSHTKRNVDHGHHDDDYGCPVHGTVSNIRT